MQLSVIMLCDDTAVDADSSGVPLTCPLTCLSPLAGGAQLCAEGAHPKVGRLPQDS